MYYISFRCFSIVWFEGLKEGRRKEGILFWYRRKEGRKKGRDGKKKEYMDKRKEGMRRLEEGMNEEMDGKKAERKRWPTKGKKE